MISRAGSWPSVGSVASVFSDRTVTHETCPRQFSGEINCGLLVVLATVTFTSRCRFGNKVRPTYKPGFNCLASTTESSCGSEVERRVILAVTFP